MRQDLFEVVRLLGQALTLIEEADKNIPRDEVPQEKIRLLIARANEHVKNAKSRLENLRDAGETGEAYRNVLTQYRATVGLLNAVYRKLELHLSERLAPDLPDDYIGPTPKKTSRGGIVNLYPWPLDYTDPPLPGYVLWAHDEEEGYPRSYHTLLSYTSDLPRYYRHGISWRRAHPGAEPEEMRRQPTSTWRIKHLPPSGVWIHVQCIPRVIRSMYYAQPPHIPLKPRIRPEFAQQLREVFEKYDRPGVCPHEEKMIGPDKASDLLGVYWSANIEKIHAKFRDVEDRLDPDRFPEDQRLETLTALKEYGKAFTRILVQRYMSVLKVPHVRNLETRDYKLEPHEKVEATQMMFTIIREKCRTKLFAEYGKYQIQTFTAEISACLEEAVRILRERHQQLGSSTIL